MSAIGDNAGVLGAAMRDCVAVSPFDIGLLRGALASQIRAAFDVDVVTSAWRPKDARVIAHVGWGKKGSGRRALERSCLDGLPCWLLEDGFLRSVGLGPGEPPLSLVWDDTGIYYDANSPSRLESLIGRPLSAAQEARARALMTRWREAGVSKYNHQRSDESPLPERFFLVVDQTFGDASIRYGQALAADFHRMLETARSDAAETNATVLLKVHPDVISGRKRGHFDLPRLQADPPVRVLASDAHPARLLERAERVYAVTSQMGFEGLLWGKPVRTFGMPFYAGWGLTTDAQPAPSRRGRATLEQLVHAALIDYPRYVDPETGKRCEPEAVLAHLGLQRRQFERYPRQLWAVGFSPWKKPIVTSFLQGSRVHFVREAKSAPADATLVLWGRKIEALASRAERVLRLEDGFVRSVGLGADLVRPLSWAIDGRGIYYDAQSPSELEHLLQHAEFPPELLVRAARVRERLVAEGLTKYNVGARRWKRPETTKRIVLVPGQVESDASIRYGAPGIRTNMGLLQAVRAAHPDAYLVYKPHPDVHAALRASGEGEERAASHCDEVVVDVPMGSLLTEVDEVCVLTSLTGFEAMLRGKPVTCYGQPFFSGWGLTRDVLRHPRRARQLTLDMLVAGALLLYPTYVSRTTGRFTTAERALDELLEWRNLPLQRVSPWRSFQRKLLGVVASLRRGRRS